MAVKPSFLGTFTAWKEGNPWLTNFTVWEHSHWHYHVWELSLLDWGPFTHKLDEDKNFKMKLTNFEQKLEIWVSCVALQDGLQSWQLQTINPVPVLVQRTLTWQTCVQLDSSEPSVQSLTPSHSWCSRMQLPSMHCKATRALISVEAACVRAWASKFCSNICHLVQDWPQWGGGEASRW